MRKEMILILLTVLLLSNARFVCAAELTDPSTWSNKEIKEWLAERNIPYMGAPEKRDLIELIKVHWGEAKEQARGTYDRIEKFIEYHVEWLNGMYENPDSIREKLADQYESVKQYTGLTQEQAQYAFNTLSERLKDKTKSAQLIDQVKLSYGKVANIIQKTTERVQRDLKNNKEVSQETIDWFKEEVNKLREPEANLVLQGIQEKFAQHQIDVSSPEQAQEIFEKLGFAIKDSYQSVNSTMERLRKELAEVIGGKAENVIEEIKSQFSTANDYSIISREKIQSVLDQIGQKLQDGKAGTVDQLQNVKEIFKRYAKYYYDAATGKAIETKEEQQDQANRIIEEIKSEFQENREKGEDQISLITEKVKENVVKSQQLTKRQTEVLTDFFKEQFGNVKVTEEKMSSLMDTLRIKLGETKEYLDQGYEKAYNKVQEGYDKTSEGYNTLKDKMGGTPSPQPHHHKDEL